MGFDADIAVIGGGISGLSAAWALARRGSKVLLFEKRHAVGGRIVSERQDGFLMEHGPNALAIPAPGMESLVSGLGLSAQRVRTGEHVRRRYLVRGGHAHALPLDPVRFFSSGFFTLGARLRLLAEPFIAPIPGDETVAQFATRRFGREFFDYLVDPLVGGLHAGDPSRLSVCAAFPRLKRLERESGSVLAGLAAARLRRNGAGAFDPRRRRLFSFRDGLAALPRALAAALGASIVTNARVAALRPARGGFRLRVNDRDIGARSVVVALPAYLAARLLAPLDPASALAAGGIAHPPLAVVFLGYPRDAIQHPLDGFGVLMPRVERRGILGVLFSSSLFPGRAPQDQVAVTAYVGGGREPEQAGAPPQELACLVHQEMRQLFRARLKPIVSRVRYWRHGLPQPEPGHLQRMARLRALEDSLPGLYVTGNYLNGVSTAACVDEALAVARRAHQHLSGASAPAHAAAPAGSARRATA
jgi:oxygen-dependent protoporphyrinogen oxidase